MDQLSEGTMDTREIIKGKLRQCYDDKIVRKDLTKKTDAGTSEGIVIGVKKLADMKSEDLPSESMWILTQEDENGTVCSE